MGFEIPTTRAQETAEMEKKEEAQKLLKVIHLYLYSSMN